MFHFDHSSGRHGGQGISSSQDEVLAMLKTLSTELRDNSKVQNQALDVLNTLASEVKSCLARSQALEQRGSGTGETHVRVSRMSRVNPNSDLGWLTASLGLDHTGRRESHVRVSKAYLDGNLAIASQLEEEVSSNGTEEYLDRHNRHSEELRARKVNEGWPANIHLREFYSKFDEDCLEADDLVDVPGNQVDSSREMSKLSLASGRRFTRSIDPSSFKVFLLDLACAIVLVNDLIISPFALAWQVDDNPAYVMISLGVSCYWVIDFLSNFFIGFYEGGVLQTSLRAIALRYLKSWFIIDSTVLTIDWIFFTVVQAGFTQGKEKTFRAFKMVKLLRLLRVMKVSKILSNSSIAMWTLSMNQTVDQIIMVLKILSVIMFINHLITCIWFMIGVEAPSDTGKRWIYQPGIDLGRPEDFDFEPTATRTDASFFFQYTCALHQITAIVTCASCYVYPNSSFEGVVNITLLIYGLLFNGTLVSFFSTTMTQRALASYERNNQLNALRNYIQQRALRSPLGLQVYVAARSRLDRSTPLTEDDVKAISLLPHELHVAVYEATRISYFMTYTLFFQWSMINREPTQQLCKFASQFIFITSGDVVFVSKQIATSAFYSVRGSLTYAKLGFEMKHNSKRTPHTRLVLPGVWLAEAALWSHWSHVGKLFANSDASLLVIEADKLPEIVAKDIRIASMTAKYAKAFHERLIAAEPPYSVWPDDIQVPDTDSSDLIGSEVCLGLLRRYAKTPMCQVAEESLAELQHEVIQGKCAIQDDGEGQIIRIVAVLAVSLERSDGCIFLEIGKLKDGRAVADTVQLPGTKRSVGELQSVATKRVLDNTLRHFDGLLEFDRIERTSFFKESKIGLKTKYTRTTYMIKVAESSCPELPLAKDRRESNLQAYLLPDPNGTGKLKVYAWLTPEMMAYYNEVEEGKDELATWVGGLEITSTDSSHMVEKFGEV